MARTGEKRICAAEREKPLLSVVSGIHNDWVAQGHGHDLRSLLGSAWIVFVMGRSDGEVWRLGDPHFGEQRVRRGETHDKRA